MGSETFPVARVHHVAAAFCLFWSLVTLVVHFASRALWPGYRHLRPREQRQWANKITCGLHAAVLSAAQARNLFDPVLNADPLHGVTDSSFFWGAQLMGYLFYDTGFSLAFFSLRSGAVMLAHHIVGLAGCAIGVYANKLALFGLAIEVFFESCNPLLHVLGCMRIARLTHLPAYAAASRAFLAQFVTCRVLIANAYLLKLLRAVLALEARPWWAWAGVAVFALLNTLNCVWACKLAAMMRREARSRRSASGTPAAAGAAAPGPAASGKALQAGTKPAIQLKASSGRAAASVLVKAD